ncbi:hypothetical protein VNO77_03845 [Canavalia gladiata]|uniref:Uncharacterized protein n=1 Tax=Canavalia gladiata TaxID=3824 RepID=A0AAN9N1W7_CANGL
MDTHIEDEEYETRLRPSRSHIYFYMAPIGYPNLSFCSVILSPALIHDVITPSRNKLFLRRVLGHVEHPFSLGLTKTSKKARPTSSSCFGHHSLPSSLTSSHHQ